MVTMGPQQDQLRHYPQLDSIRTFAVGAVMVHHLWFEEGRLAIWGVKLFFVISGFLITQILVSSRTAAGDHFPMRLAAIGRFYARRFLRIFPLYYMVVGVALLLGLSPTRRILGWLLSYLLNFKMASQDYYEDWFAHFWTLCVEEQFYLVWPWIIFLVPKRKMAYAALSLIAGAIGFRALYVVMGDSLTTSLGAYILPFASLDSLGLGALLAIAASVRKPQEVSKALWILVPSALILLVAASYSEGKWVRFTPSETLRGVVFCGIVWAAVRNTGGVVGWILSLAPLVFLGRISYGLYVYHPFVPSMLRWVSWRLSLPKVDSSPFLSFCLASAFTIVLASLSWYAFERPLNALKRHFRDPVVQPPDQRAINPIKAAGASSGVKVIVLSAVLAAAAVGGVIYSVMMKPPAVLRVLVATQATWRYESSGRVLGDQWIQSSYEDLDWPEGNAPLGYGDPVATAIPFGPDSEHKQITAYFRHVFSVDDLEVTGRLVAQFIRDDGVVLYLNGKEFARDNMPAGPIAYTTLASVGAADADETQVHEAEVPRSLIVKGRNVLAAEVHQNAATSSDMRFDCALVVVKR